MLFDATVPQLVKPLRQLSSFLDKAAAYAESKKCDPDVFLQLRLAPDMFPLVRQVQFACDTARMGAYRLADRPVPPAPDTEKTIAELKARIESTIEAISGFQAADIDSGAERRISQPRWEGKSLSGKEYALNHMLPNFYFHVTTTYAILRSNGVDVGKKDYLGAMPFRDPS